MKPVPPATRQPAPRRPRRMAPQPVPGRRPEGLRAAAGTDYALRLLVEGMNEGAATVEADGTIVYANPRLGAMVGRAAVALVGRPALELATGPDRKALARLLEIGTDDRGPCELELTTAAGGRVPVLVSVSGFGLARASLRSLIVTDLSARHEADRELDAARRALQVSEALTHQTQALQRRADEQLRVANERIRRLYEANLLGVVVGAESGAIVEANDYYLHLIGYTRAQLEAGEVDWRAITPPEWVPASDQAIAELPRDRREHTL